MNKREIPFQTTLRKKYVNDLMESDNTKCGEISLEICFKRLYVKVIKWTIWVIKLISAVTKMSCEIFNLVGLKNLGKIWLW